MVFPDLPVAQRFLVSAHDQKTVQARLCGLSVQATDRSAPHRHRRRRYLASLYTYERQIPEIAETKIQGLKNHYGCSSKKGLEFFEAHKSADVHHRAECEKLLDGLSKEEQKKAEKAALSTAKYLWNFLSGMTAKHNLQVAA